MSETSSPRAAFTVPHYQLMAQRRPPPKPSSRSEAAGKSSKTTSYFQMPLHYPRNKKRDNETVPEWKLDSCVLNEYGLPNISLRKESLLQELFFGQTTMTKF
ncbi:hypothetical protein ACOSP7_024635 [Xanthoceras sorbifolium]